MTTISTTIAYQVRAAFSFSIDKFPLSGPEGMKTPFYGLFRSDTAEVVHDKSVSKTYEPHTTEDVIALVEAAQSVFGGCSPKLHFNKGHYVDLMPSNAERLRVYGTNDNIVPRLHIRASYDGRSFMAGIGYYRDLCRNLSMLRKVNATTVIIRHNSNLRDKMDELIEQFAGLEQGWVNLSDVVTRMQTAEVSLTGFLNRIYGDAPAETGSSLTRHQNRTEAIVRRVIRERNLSGRPALQHTDDTISAWEAYNAIQGYTQHDMPRKGSPSEMERVLRASKQTEVAAAEDYAMQLIAA